SPPSKPPRRPPGATSRGTTWPPAMSPATTCAATGRSPSAASPAIRCAGDPTPRRWPRSPAGARSAWRCTPPPFYQRCDVTLSTAIPIALLPVRLETRFADDASGGVLLKVRIYPDQIHVDAHDPSVTPLEKAARADWLKGKRDLPAWRDLVSLVGPTR